MLMAATIRRLRDSDRDDILEMSRHTWEGHDYLSSVVDEWLHDPRSHFYGVEVDGHVVAVGNLRLLEDGWTGWMEGLRVHLEYRGRGFANDITLYFVGKAESLGVGRLRYTTSTENAASVRLAKMAGFRKVLRMAVLWHPNPRLIPRIRGYPPIRKQSPERTCRLLETSPRTVPHGIVVYDWKAVDITCPSIEKIGRTHEFFIALKERKIDSLSFGSSGQGSNRPWWNFTVCAADSHGFISQLSHNLTLASKHGLSSIACTFETRFEKTLDELKLGEGRDGTHLVLFEKALHLEKTQS
jgi:RimJ/RimL family protein N-acetyltransferase